MLWSHFCLCPARLSSRTQKDIESRRADRRAPPPLVRARDGLQFKTQLPNVSATDASGLVVKITGVTAIEGDVTVGQRKSK